MSVQFKRSLVYFHHSKGFPEMELDHEKTDAMLAETRELLAEAEAAALSSLSTIKT